MRIRPTLLVSAAILLCAAPHAGAVPPAPSHSQASKIGLDAMLLPVGNTKIALVRVSAGTFSQGAPAADDLHEPNEVPAHKTTVTGDFYLAETPTTREQFEAFVADAGYQTEAERGSSGGSGWNGSALVQGKQYTWRNPGFPQTEKDPVVLVTFDDALAFASWVQTKTGHHARLPTEAEYELASRAGTNTRWYSGDDKPNGLGLYDMSGNVWEWCADAFGPYSAVPATDPLAKTGEAGQPLRRVLRGGSWLKDSSHARSSARYRNTPGSRNADNGFRIALDLTSTAVTAPTHKPLLPTGTGTTTGDTPQATTPGVTTPTSSGAGADRTGWSVLGVLLAFGSGLAAIIFAIFGIRRLTRSASGGGGGGDNRVTTRNGADGFFLVAPTLAAGSRVQYTCLVNGTWRGGVVPTAGVETFVYTGTPPAQVRIVRILAAEAPAWRQPAAPAITQDFSSNSSSSSSSTSSSDDSSFLGSPRAY